ncbi:MAG TPA: glycosyltransferase family 2 protein [Solirubrobacterales bacterium]|nr:glycosyltransferase family 2 protein [Solirubrobacterales bacterium]
MRTSRPDLSVVVVTHNGRDLALGTLRSAIASTGAIACEWFVVDNASTDGTPEAIEGEFGEVTVVRAPNRGFAAGNNVGIERARGRYVLLLNPDVEIRSGTFAELLATLDQRREVGIASVVQRGADGALQHSMRRFPSPARDLGESLFASRWPAFRSLQEVEVDPRRYAVETSPDWVCGAFLCARAEAVEEIGPLDERFFLYSEEIDWCLRARTCGWDVRHLPSMTITHHAGRRDRGDLMAQLAYSRSLFAAKHHGRLGAAAIRAALALGNLLRIAITLPVAPFSAAARARVAAEARALRVLLGLAGPPLRAEPVAPPTATKAAAVAEAS